MQSSACFGTTYQSPCSSSTRHAARSHRHLPRLTSSVCRHFLCPPHFAGKNFVVVHFDSGRSHGRSLRGDCFNLFDLLPHGHPRSFGWCQLFLAKMAMAQASSSQSQRSMAICIAAPQGTSNACAPRARTCAGGAPCNVRTIRNTYFNLYYYFIVVLYILIFYFVFLLKILIRILIFFF